VKDRHAVIGARVSPNTPTRRRRKVRGQNAHTSTSSSTHKNSRASHQGADTANNSCNARDQALTQPFVRGGKRFADPPVPTRTLRALREIALFLWTTEANRRDTSKHVK
ncbi:unnamed protein product, partial [Ectocarpus sp. 6 AP-2014]